MPSSQLADVVLSLLKLHSLKIKCCGMIILVQEDMLAPDVATGAETVTLTKEEFWGKAFHLVM